MKTETVIWFGFVLALVLGCAKTESNDGNPAPGGSRQLEPGSPVELTLSPSREVERAEVMTALGSVATLTATDFAAKYHVPFATGIGYDPTSAKGLDLIQGSSLKLLDDELAALQARGSFRGAADRRASMAGTQSSISVSIMAAGTIRRSPTCTRS
jgi:hypothetical protein